MLITTSRKPSRRCRSLCKDLTRVFPKSRYINRGKMNMKEVLSLCRPSEYLLLITEWHANPANFKFYTPDGTLCLAFRCKGIRLQREFERENTSLKARSLGIRYDKKMEEFAKALERVIPFTKNYDALMDIRNDKIVFFHKEIGLKKPWGPMLKIKQIFM